MWWQFEFWYHVSRTLARTHIELKCRIIYYFNIIVVQILGMNCPRPLFTHTARCISNVKSLNAETWTNIIQILFFFVYARVLSVGNCQILKLHSLLFCFVLFRLARKSHHLFKHFMRCHLHVWFLMRPHLSVRLSLSY